MSPTPGEPAAPPPDDGLGPRRSRRKAVLQAASLSYGSLAVALTRNLVLVPFYLRYMDAGEYGAWLATGAVLAYLMMSDLGLSGVLTQRTAAQYGSRDAGGLGRTVGTGLLLACGLSLSLSALAAALSPFIGNAIALEPEVERRVEACFLIVALANGVNLVGLSAGDVLRSLQRPLVPGTLTLLAQVAGVGVTVLLLVWGHGLYAIAWGLAAQGILAALCNVLACVWTCVRRLHLRLRWSGDEFRSVFRGSLWQAVTSLSIRVQARADTFFVGVVLGAQAAAVFGLTIRAHETIQMVGAQIGGALVPSLAHLHGSGDQGRFAQILRKMLLVQALVGALGMGGVVALNHAFVTLWVGPDLYAGAGVNVAFAAFVFVTLVGGATYAGSLSLGRFESIAKVLLTTAAARLLLLPILLTVLGLTGGALAALVAGTLRLLLLGSVLMRRIPELARSVRESVPALIRLAVPPWLLATAVAASGWMPGSWLGFAAEGIAFTVAATAACLLAMPSFAGELIREIRGARTA